MPVEFNNRHAAGASETEHAWARFSRVEYRGHPYGGQVAQADEFENPILPGFFPDPSICRVGEDFYLVNSSFSLFPAIPIFHSRDLINWQSCGHVLDRISQMQTLQKAPISSGIYAPTIRFDHGKFFVTCTLVSGGGNFFVTATDPAGPWSDLIWMPDIHGIDPSPYFEDGRMYVVHNGDCPGTPKYDGHKAIRMQEICTKTGNALGESRVLVNGGTDLTKKPIWIEGPHLLRRDGHYYLIAAEGGTEENHSVVVFRSNHLWGPYVPWEENPILTQRDLREDRPNIVTCTGHADLVELPDGSWWAVFLACRPYEGRLFNTGRETFLLPVTWTDEGWPRILERGMPLPLTPRRPAIALPSTVPATAREYTLQSDFRGQEIGPEWVTLRVPAGRWIESGDGSLRLAALPETLRSKEHASVLATRQRHLRFLIETTLVDPRDSKDFEAGLVAYQDDRHHIFLYARAVGGGFVDALLEVTDGEKVSVLNLSPLRIGAREVSLRILGDGRWYSFQLTDDPIERNWKSISQKVDGSILSTAVAGGFQGVCLGLHARELNRRADEVAQQR